MLIIYIPEHTIGYTYYFHGLPHRVVFVKSPINSNRLYLDFGVVKLMDASAFCIDHA